MAGGGGFGNPFERDPERVRKDVVDGKVTRKHAREAYGVVLSEAEESPVVDMEATQLLRAAPRQ
jgi:N-methylhydantoinase B